ncbi:uncharacterized protein C2845_PM07G16840 [Panicum miliaceum]|uniref:DUF1645 family protein n=1 Tax=Panicum miliaceum TaxID=4540 RepID=A0A3L6SQH3_PANMI|nr:uncharacterized protein C2845_PM07G16840 [Panicum miliaceum]
MEDKLGARRHEPAGAELPVSGEDGGSVASDVEDSDSEFEFPSVSREPAVGGGGAAAADELFTGGRIRAFYPVFGRVLDDEAAPAAPRAPLGQLFQLEQARTSSVASTSSTFSSSSSASTADGSADLDGVAPDSYCVWTPGSSPASSPSRPPRKSGSTGSVARWRRIGDLVVGRSRSDGKQKFLFLSAPPSPARDREHFPAASKPKPPSKGSKAAAAAATELDTVAAGRRMSYGGAKASPGRRRTFLPYRQDLMGLFANAHLLSRSPPHPF